MQINTAYRLYILEQHFEKRPIHVVFLGQNVYNGALIRNQPNVDQKVDLPQNYKLRQSFVVFCSLQSLYFGAAFRKMAKSSSFLAQKVL